MSAVITKIYFQLIVSKEQNSLQVTVEFVCGFCLYFYVNRILINFLEIVHLSSISSGIVILLKFIVVCKEFNVICEVSLLLNFPVPLRYIFL